MSTRGITRSWARLPSSLTPKPSYAQVAFRNSSSSSSSKIGDVHFDQTKRNNDPDAEHTEEHAQNSKYADMDDSGVHPTKDMNPEMETSRSTGIKTEGQGKRAGEGENKNVHKETREKPGPNMTWGGDK